MTKRNVRLAIVSATTLLIGMFAHADTVFLKDKPGAVITVSQAASSKTPVFKCEKVHQGPNINPVKVAGSQTVWSSSPGAGVEDVAALLDNKQTGYRCKSMLLDKSTGRMKAESL